ncbi:hypothetical protein E3N88_29559 [Mikania micrantha]|uniref:Core domain-containing protein n=1 Tax=Mikania micrantha TaxID=192012 RepID=A0A5N6MJT6_9ASTR|nr:hypothetical protein E3N88_29559 [Mikania micrantha]
MAISSTMSPPSLCRIPKVSMSSLPLNQSASLSSRSFPSCVNLNLRRSSLSIRAVSTQAAPASGGIAPAIALTDNALKHLNKMRSEKNEDLCLRIGVKQGGCSGMSYSMEFESKKNTRPDDTVMEYDGFVIVCDPKSLLFIFGMQLDFSDALIGGGFSFKNPNATQTCGCGKSFAA